MTVKIELLVAIPDVEINCEVKEGRLDKAKEIIGDCIMDNGYSIEILKSEEE